MPMFPNTMTFIVIWPNGHVDEFDVETWIELIALIHEQSNHFGLLPNLVYRKPNA